MARRYPRDRLSKNHEATETLRIATLTNQALLDETLSLAHGDDYEGDFTRNGYVTFELLKEELYKRLSSWFGP